MLMEPRSGIYVEQLHQAEYFAEKVAAVTHICIDRVLYNAIQ